MRYNEETKARKKIVDVLQHAGLVHQDEPISQDEEFIWELIKIGYNAGLDDALIVVWDAKNRLAELKRPEFP